MLFTVKDTFSRWFEAFPLKFARAATAIECLEREVFSRFGIPETIHSDQGTPFTSREFRTFADKFGIHLSVTPSYHPQSNTVERAHRDLGNALRAMVSEENDPGLWEEYLPWALHALRTRINRITGVSPHQLVFGRNAAEAVDHIFGLPREGNDSAQGKKRRAKDPLSYLKEARRRMDKAHAWARENIGAEVARQRLIYQSARQAKYSVGDKVWLFSPAGKAAKLATRWSGPWTVVRRLTDSLFQLAPHPDWKLQPTGVTAATDRLRLCVLPPNAKSVPPVPGQQHRLNDDPHFTAWPDHEDDRRGGGQDDDDDDDDEGGDGDDGPDHGMPAGRHVGWYPVRPPQQPAAAAVAPPVAAPAIGEQPPAAEGPGHIPWDLGGDLAHWRVGSGTPYSGSTATAGESRGSSSQDGPYSGSTDTASERIAADELAAGGDGGGWRLRHGGAEQEAGALPGHLEEEAAGATTNLAATAAEDERANAEMTSPPSSVEDEKRSRSGSPLLQAEHSGSLPSYHTSSPTNLEDHPSPPPWELSDIPAPTGSPEASPTLLPNVTQNEPEEKGWKIYPTPARKGKGRGKRSRRPPTPAPGPSAARPPSSRPSASRSLPLEPRKQATPAGRRSRSLSPPLRLPSPARVRAPGATASTARRTKRKTPRSRSLEPKPKKGRAADLSTDETHPSCLPETGAAAAAPLSERPSDAAASPPDERPPDTVPAGAQRTRSGRISRRPPRLGQTLTDEQYRFYVDSETESEIENEDENRDRSPRASPPSCHAPSNPNDDADNEE